MSLFPSVGGAAYAANTVKIIRLIRHGCTNRPFFLISVMEKRREPYEPTIEQLGSYDPLPNSENEKLVAINFKRLEHWIREGADITLPVLKLLGLAGYFPVHPGTYEDAWKNRKKIMELLEKLRITAKNISESKGNEAPTPSTPSTPPTSSSTVSSDSEPSTN